MMKPYYQDDAVQIFCGDCREIVPALGPVDAVVTDPPYGLRFMGKAWDYDVPGVDLWRVVFAALKPGGHCLAFAGTRTQHRMAVNIEDAGFEIRDMIAWVYGSGFPKSLCVSKQLDRMAGAEREVVGFDAAKYRPNRQGRALVGGGTTGGFYADNGATLTAPATDAAKQWQGFGTAIKPAMEPITVARKPLDGTVAENVLKHGTGAINVDGCRVACNGEVIEQSGETVDIERGKCADGYDRRNATMFRTGKPKERGGPAMALGRWPANLIHDGSDEVVGLFPQTGGGHWSYKQAKDGGLYKHGLKDMPDAGTDTEKGSAARFFYCAKASRSERGDDNTHPTVKPLALMRYLIRLVLPPGGVLLDPFAGSGTTGLAAIAEGRKAILIEREERYCEIAARRMAQQVLPLGT
jgi:site-specific DNA-methyltransferase (adenine-specific)